MNNYILRFFGILIFFLIALLIITQHAKAQDYYAISSGDWNETATWSESDGGPEAASTPTTGDDVQIEGYKVDVTDTQDCASITIIANSSHTDLTIDGGTLTLTSDLTLQNSGTNKKGQIFSTNSGTFNIGGNVLLDKDGGNQKFKIRIDVNSTMSISGNLTFDIDGGGGSENTIVAVKDGSILTIDGDVHLDHGNGQPAVLRATDDGILNLNGDLQFTATGNSDVKVVIKDQGVLNFSGDIIRGSPAYGTITFESLTSMSINSSTEAQIIPDLDGDEGSETTFANLIINNTFGTPPQVTLSEGIIIEESLTLNNGIIESTAAKLITLSDDAEINGGSSTSYVDGPLKKIGDDIFTFHIGDNGYYAPMKISAPGNTTAEFVGEYFDSAPSNREDLGTGVVSVSASEYWDLDRPVGSSPDDDVYITLFWEDGDRSGIIDESGLVVSHYTGTEWENLGQNVVTGDQSEGSVESFTKLGTFSEVTTGGGDGGTLPIKLSSFNVELVAGIAEIKWTTESEINNEFFTIERSIDGVNFEELGTVQGAGNSKDLLFYMFTDNDVPEGTIYYILKQTDYDGEFEYSDIIALSNNGNFESSCELFVNPNPCNGSCIIRFDDCTDEEQQQVNFSVYDALGNKVMTSASKNIEQGSTTFSFDPTNNLKPALYIIRGSLETDKMEKRVIITK